MKKAYLFCSHTIPREHPNGVRFANIGLILRELGYEVWLFGSEIGEGEKSSVYKGMNCYIWRHSVASGARSAYEREKARCRYVRSALEEHGMPDIIISGLFNCKAQCFLINYGRKNNIPVMESVCEWFDRNNYAGVSGMAKFANNRFSMHYQFPRMKNIIAISSLLEEYYKERGCRTVYLPTLVDMEEYAGLEHVPNQKMVIAYAGSPAKKDYIVNVIRAIELLKEEERDQLELHLYGPKAEQLVALGISLDYLEKYKETIICHGRIPYEQVKMKIAAADFTVLLRPNKRYANAGFPTKVGESMACGTPVMANMTSDLQKYVLNGETGIVCEDESPSSCAQAFRYALSLSKEQRDLMREKALEMASRVFNYEKYVRVFESFLEDCHAK